MSENDVKPGSQTSEFAIAKLVIFAGIGLDVLGALLEALKHAGFDFGFLPVAMVLVGTLSALIAGLGYSRSRTMVKVAALAPKLGAEVAHLRPLFVEVQSIIKEARESKAASQPTLPSGPPSSLPE